MRFLCPYNYFILLITYNYKLRLIIKTNFSAAIFFGKRKRLQFNEWLYNHVLEILSDIPCVLLE